MSTKPAVSPEVLRWALIALGAAVSVGTTVQDKLSAHPEMTWKSLITVAGVALAAWAKQWIYDVSQSGNLPFLSGGEGADADPTDRPAIPAPADPPTTSTDPQ